MENKKFFSKLGLFLFIATLLINGVQWIAVTAANAIPAIAQDSNLYFMATMLPMYIIAYPIIFALFKKLPVTLSGEKKKMRPLHLLAAFLMGYAGMFVCNIFANILTFIVGLLMQNRVENVMLTVTGSVNVWVNLFVIVICAPIMEELLFRKTIVDRTAKYGEGVTIVVSGLVFGLFHGNLVQFAYAFFLGAFFGFIYMKTRDIKYTIILHMITNFFGSFVSAVLIDVTGYGELLDLINVGAGEVELMASVTENAVGILIFFGYALLLMGFAITGFILFIVNRKKFVLNPGEVTIEKGRRFRTVILNVGMILYCAFWLVMIVLQLLGI